MLAKAAVRQTARSGRAGPGRLPWMTGTDDAGAPLHGHPHSAEADVACAMAHGELPASTGDRRLVAVFASSVAVTLAHIAAHVGYDVVVLDPDPERPCPGLARVSDVAAVHLDDRTDVVVTCLLYTSDAADDLL